MRRMNPEHLIPHFCLKLRSFMLPLSATARAAHFHAPMRKNPFVFQCLLLFLANSAYAQQPGDLDVSFGIDGFTTIDVAGQGLFDQVSRIELQPDGKVIFCGRMRNVSGTESDVLIGRVTSAGVPDMDFGDQGTVVIDLGGDSESSAGLTIEADGGILVFGTSDQSGVSQHVLLRFIEDGSLDIAFGDNGTIFNSPTASGSTLTAFATDTEGNHLVTGSGGGDLLLVKHLPSGYPDNSFGTSGTVLHDLAAVHETAMRCLIQPDGRIVLAGSQLQSSENTLIARLLPDGTLDQSFNGSGWLNLSLSEWIDQIGDIALLPDGKLLVVGSVSEAIGADYEIFAVRLMQDGSFDNSFGTSGIARFDVGTGSDFANVLVLQPDGKYIIGGGFNNNSTTANEDFGLLRINHNGSLDLTFGTNGTVTTEIGSSYERIVDMALQDDGKLMVAGTARIGASEDIALARYHTGLNTSISEVTSSNQLEVFPNPALETLTVRSESDLQHLELLDALGRTVLTRTPSTAEVQLHLSALPAGIYLLRATDGTATYSKRVVKE